MIKPYHLTLKDASEAHPYRDRPYRCWWCGVELTEPRSDGVQIATTRTRDHLHPKPQRAPGVHAVTVAACARCNGTRGALPAERWDEWLLSPKGQEYLRDYMLEVLS